MQTTKKKSTIKFSNVFFEEKKYIGIFSRVVKFDNHVLVAPMELLAA